MRGRTTADHMDNGDLGDQQTYGVTRTQETLDKREKVKLRGGCLLGGSVPAWVGEG